MIGIVVVVVIKSCGDGVIKMGAIVVVGEIEGVSRCLRGGRKLWW